MQSPTEAQDLNDFSMEAINALFEPTVASIWSPESSRLIAPDHSRTRIHSRNVSTESASSFMIFDEGSHPLTPATPHSSYEAYPQLSQARRRANSEEEDHSDDLDLDPNATDEQKKGYKRRQNTLAARRSRAKRALETQSLRDENARLKTENAIWKERALMMERLLATHGVPCPGFST